MGHKQFSTKTGGGLGEHTPTRSEQTVCVALCNARQKEEEGPPHSSCVSRIASKLKELKKERNKKAIAFKK